MRNRRSTLGVLIAACAMVASVVCPGSAQKWTTAGPLPRYSHSAILDPGTNRMVVFGGILNGGTNSTQDQNFNDVWRLSGNAWTAVRPSGSPPAPRNGQSAVYDPGSNRMVVFGGGLGFSSPCANDLWVLTNTNGNGGTSAWIELNPTGGPPAPRERHTAVYDSGTNTMIVFGGNNCFSSNFGDVWVLSNANGLGETPTWTELFPSGAGPGATEDHTAVYDPGSNSMIVFGGGSNSNAVWVLSNANGQGGTPIWTQLGPAGTLPPGRDSASAVYDATNNRMTVFGGNGTTGVLGDVWVLSKANGLGGTPAWTELGPFTTFAEARQLHTAVYNPSTNKMTVFGGYTANAEPNNIANNTNDLWILSHANGL